MDNIQQKGGGWHSSKLGTLLQRSSRLNVKIRARDYPARDAERSTPSDILRRKPSVVGWRKNVKRCKITISQTNHQWQIGSSLRLRKFASSVSIPGSPPCA
eukprot:4390979-Pleurochrysis_carterae.AAC.3